MKSINLSAQAFLLILAIACIDLINSYYTFKGN